MTGLDLLHQIRAAHKTLTATLSAAGLTPALYPLLRAVADNPDNPIGHYAENLEMASSTLTVTIDRLEHAGFIRRVRPKHDRRTILLAMTPVGQTALDEAERLLEVEARA